MRTQLKIDCYFCNCSFPCGSAGKESVCDAGDLDLISGLGRSPGEGKGYSLPFSGLENSMDCTAGHKQLARTELLSLSLFYNCIFT